MTDTPEQPGPWLRLKRFLRRMPALERRWIPDESERDEHDRHVRHRLRTSARPRRVSNPEPPDEPANAS